MAQQRINQIINQGGKEVECVLPKILRGAIEDVNQTPFRLLRNFRKQQLNKLKKGYCVNNTCIFVIMLMYTPIIMFFLKKSHNTFFFLIYFYFCLIFYLFKEGDVSISPHPPVSALVNKIIIWKIFSGGLVSSKNFVQVKH